MASDLEARRRAVAESLDCASHRLDAWATAVVSERRAPAARRGDAAGAGRGLTIGAWGVVEDLLPGAGPGSGRLDPRADHPARGHRRHAAQLPPVPPALRRVDGGPFAIDLSGARARRAAASSTASGGQQLAALVGYQVERGLAEAGLARLQLSLRTVAPLVARRLHDRDDADTDVRARVGRRHQRRRRPAAAQASPARRHRAARPARPTAGNAFLPSGDWKPMTDAEWAAVTRVLRAAAGAVDTVADVMLSESVMQYAAGNATRAAAAMDVVSTAPTPATASTCWRRRTAASG